MNAAFPALPGVPDEGYWRSHGPRLIEQGYDVVPIAPGTKRPKGLDWQNKNFNTLDFSRTLRGCGVGIKGTSTPGIDLDITDPEMLSEMETWIAENIGQAPKRIGRAPRSLFVCRTDAPFRTIRSRALTSPDGEKQQVEIIADGGQFVAYAIHPDTGQPYDWPDAELVDIPLAELPELTKEKASAFIVWFERKALARGWVAESRSTDKMAGEEHRSSISPRAPVWVLAEAMREISIFPETYDRWTKFGMAIYHATDGSLEGFALWDKWSQSGAKYDGGTSEKWETFGSYTGRRLGAGTIFYEADKTSGDWRERVRAIDPDWRRKFEAEQFECTRRRYAAALEKIRRPAESIFDSASPHRIEDFWAYLPKHEYIFTPTGDMWPASTINSVFGKLAYHGVKVLATKWLDLNRPVHQMTWLPGRPAIIEDCLLKESGWIDRPGSRVLNLYKPPILTACGVASETAMWINHVAHVYPDEVEHILQWLAHRVQRPNEKVNHALVLGGTPGVGKDTILEPVRHAVGPWNFADVSPQQVLSRFNGGFLKSVILRINEARDLGDADRFSFHDHMKMYTAAPPDVLRVEEKYIPSHPIPNICGVVVTTNHKTDGIYIPADDRRHFVAWSPRFKEEFDAEYWRSIYSWFANGGTAHVAEYLGKLDISAFDPKAPPPKTAAFWEMVNASRVPEDAEIADAIETLGNPSALTIADICTVAGEVLRQSLTDRHSRRRLPHRMEAVGYNSIRNPAASDGLWKVGGARQVIYAKQALSQTQKLEAAEKRAREVRMGSPNGSRIDLSHLPRSR